MGSKKKDIWDKDTYMYSELRDLHNRGNVKDYLEEKGIKESFISLLSQNGATQDEIDYFLTTPIVTDDFTKTIDQQYDKLLLLSLNKEVLKTTTGIVKEGLKTILDIAKDCKHVFSGNFKK